MPLKTLEERLRDIVVEQLGIEPDQVVKGATFVQDFGVDSLDAIEITMAVEEDFSVEISEDEFDEARTFGKLIELVEKKTGRAARRTTAG